jgi:hypothetical protein
MLAVADAFAYTGHIQAARLAERLEAYLLARADEIGQLAHEKGDIANRRERYSCAVACPVWRPTQLAPPHRIVLTASVLEQSDVTCSIR